MSKYIVYALVTAAVVAAKRVRGVRAPTEAAI